MRQRGNTPAETLASALRARLSAWRTTPGYARVVADSARPGSGKWYDPMPIASAAVLGS